MAAADQLRSVGSSHDHPLAAADKLLGSAGGHGAQGSDAQRQQAQKAIESRWMAGVRARHGQGAGRVSAVEAAHDSYSDALDRCVRAPHVPPPVHERSHEDARLPHAPVPWQVVGSLQRLFHESTLSIPSLLH